MSTDRCDKCGTPKELWATTPCIRSLTKSPRHPMTRFFLPIRRRARGSHD